MRIFDRIASGEPVYDHKSQQVDALLRKPVHSFIRVIADEAATYDDLYPPKQAHIHKDEFGCLLPPFYEMWVEWQMPFEAHQAVLPDGRILGAPESVAVLVESTKRPYGYEMRCGPVVTHRRGEFMSVIPAGVRVEMDEMGHCLGVYSVMDERARDEVSNLVGAEQDWVSPMYPLFQVIGWMNCKTFDLEEVQVPAKQRKKRRSNNQFEGLSYHRIVVGARYRHQWQGAGGIGANRFHVVRGHIADHRQHGLFGDPKRRGMYWVPGHARGDKTRGIVNKEYHVTDEAAQ